MKKTASLLFITAFVLIAANAHAQDCDCERYYIGFWSNGVDTMRITETTISINGHTPVEYTVDQDMWSCYAFYFELQTPTGPKLSQFMAIMITEPYGNSMVTECYDTLVQMRCEDNCTNRLTWAKHFTY